MMTMTAFLTTVSVTAGGIIDIYITYTDEICVDTLIFYPMFPPAPTTIPPAQPEHLSLHCELDIPHKTFIILLCIKEVRNKVGI